MSSWRKDSYLRYCSPTPKILLFGVVLLLIAGLSKILELIAICFVRLLHKNTIIDFSNLIAFFLVSSCASLIIAIIEIVLRSTKRDIKYVVRKGLCASCYGNPINLHEGEIEPSVIVTNTDRGYKITVDCISADYDDVASLETVISGYLRNRYANYAVVSKEEDIAGRYVDYYIEDVVANYNKQSVYSSADDVPSHLTKIYIRKDVYIDYARVLNSSAIVAGRSRSGKTTAVISTFLLPILKLGRDDYGSRIIIIDPKSAELSLCPHVLSPAPNGSVEHILNAIRDFNSIRVERQRIINDYCKSEGKAVKWFDVGMKPCVLFLDEFVSIQDMFPKKATKEKPDYSLADFQGLLRHTFTTRMCEAGVNIKAMQSILGHADAETTLDIYAEATKDLKKSELISFEKFFNNQKDAQIAK